MFRSTCKFLFIALSLVSFIATANDGSSILRTRLENHVRVLTSDSLQGRGLGTEGAVKARDYIIAQFSEAGILPFENNDSGFVMHFRFRQGNAWIDGFNIAGLIEGSDPVLKNEFIVLGAHYDHLGYDLQNNRKRIFPGADDNASGVAAIIELGRYFTANPGRTGRSIIIVAFDAEESGLIGSREFVRNPPVPVENMRLMLSFDMVGMYSANRGLHLTRMGSLLNGSAMAKTVADNHMINLRRTGSRIERRTDTAPFADSGIPAVHVFTGTKSPYHKPEDTYDRLDYDGMVVIHHLV